MGSSSFKGFSLLGLLALLIFLGGCSIVPRELRKEIDRSISFKELKANPDAHVGRTVVLGGEIIETKNLKDRTELEILQKPLGRRDVPIEIVGSEGRFLVNHPGYLDPAVYRRGRYVTVVGEVTGERSRMIGESEYRYPIISAKFLHLWPCPRRYYWPYYPYYYYPYYYYPYYYPYYPFYGSFYLGWYYYRHYPPWPYRYYDCPSRHHHGHHHKHHRKK